MTTLLQAQKTLNADPVVNLMVGSADLSAYLARYKYHEKHGAAGRVALWLDNTGGAFDNLATDWPAIARGAEAVLTRGLRVAGEELTAALPTVWVESLMYVYQKEQSYLVLDCIDWVKRLQYYRYATEQTWAGQLVETIVAAILGEVGLTLTAGAWSTALSIDYTISPSKSAWTALQELLSKVPEKLYALPGKIIGFRVLDVEEAAGYDYGYNTILAHPLLPKTSEAEASPRYNWIKVRSDTTETYSGIASDATEIASSGYRRRTITDRTLTSDAECLSRAEAELEVWSAKSTAGVIVARPHFTVRLFDVISAPAPLWGGRPIGSGSVTRIIEWYNFPNRPYDQALTIGELPDAALLLLGDDVVEEEPAPVDPLDPTEPPEPPTEVDPPPVTEDGIDPGAVATATLADGAVTTAKIADEAVTGPKIDGFPNDGAYFLDGTGAWSIPSGTGSGEANDGQNIGAGGVGVYHGKSGVHLQFKNLNAGSSKITVTDDSTNDEVDVDVVEANLDLANIGGQVGATQIAILPKCKVYGTDLNQSIPTGGITQLTWNAEEFDTDSIHNLVTNNQRLTCQTAGSYDVGGFIIAVGITQPQNVIFMVCLNGTSVVSRGANYLVSSYTGGYCVFEWLTPVSLAVSDYLTVEVSNNQGQAVTIYKANTAASQFWMSFRP